LSAAQLEFEFGQYHQSAALFDSVARYPFEPNWRAARGLQARHLAWALTLAATALVADHDTATASRLADSIEAIGRLSSYGRDALLYHHVRGLLLASRGRDADAVRELRASIFSPTEGYTRTNLELAKALVRLGRAREAVPVLRSALHSSMESGSLYVTLTEVHELMAEAFDACGQPDSAVAHWRRVASAWRHADPQFKSRVDRALRRLGLVAEQQPHRLRHDG